MMKIKDPFIAYAHRDDLSDDALLQYPAGSREVVEGEDKKTNEE